MGMLGCCRVVLAQWSEGRQLRSEALGSITSGYPSFFLQYVSILIYQQLPYQQFLLPVVVIRIVTKLIMYSVCQYVGSKCSTCILSMSIFHRQLISGLF